MANHVCPWWLGYVLANPIRKLIENPEQILSPYIRAGMTVLDVGCAMGFFSLPLARMVGPSGRVICIDLQPKMISALQKRIDKAGLGANMETRLCRADSLQVEDLHSMVDFALAAHVLHEMPDPASFFPQLQRSKRPRGRFLIAEPIAHVSAKAFERSTAPALSNGFETGELEKSRRSLSRLFTKTA